jgi:hypothetical protein
MLGWPRWRRASAHSAESYACSARDRETSSAALALEQLDAGPVVDGLGQ